MAAFIRTLENCNTRENARAASWGTPLKSAGAFTGLQPARVRDVPFVYM